MDAALTSTPAQAGPVDSPGLTFACALALEEAVARRAGLRTARVGLGASRPLPAGRLAGFGLAGALVPGLEPGEVLSARRVVGEQGELLWEGEPLTVPGARPAVLCAASRVVDDPGERARLADRTGAVAVDLESGALARTGRLAGVVRVVSDTPDRRVGRLGQASTADGGVAWRIVAQAFLSEPLTASRAALAGRRALRALDRSARALAGGAP